LSANTSGGFRISVTWEQYYSSLKQLPRRLKTPVPFLAEALPFFKQLKVKRVLDLGCGAGRNSIYLAKKRFDVVGIDVSKSALKHANKWAEKERLPNATFTLGTMTNIPIDDCYFDAVVSISVIHHGVRKDIMETINEIHRILKKKGVFIANIASVKDPRYGEGKKVEENTYRILEAFEEYRFEELHHFFTRREASEILTCFSNATAEILKEKPNYWKITAVK
jgi:ubiquinone/menaquinone biosynthesis C-methylase UbiE